MVSSDTYRTLVGDVEYLDWKGRPREEADILYSEYQKLSGLAFEAMNTVVSMRSRLGKLTVVDATHLQPEYRRKYIEIAAGHDLPCVAWVLDVPEQTLLARDQTREQPRGRQRVKSQYSQFKRCCAGCARRALTLHTCSRSLRLYSLCGGTIRCWQRLAPALM